MDSLAAAQDSVLERLERSKVQGECGPRLNKKESADFWFAKAKKDGAGAPSLSQTAAARYRCGQTRRNRP